MKKKSMLTALVMLSLLQGSVYAEEFKDNGGTGWTFNCENDEINTVNKDYNKYVLVVANGSADETKDLNTGKIHIVDEFDGDQVYGILSHGSVTGGYILMDGGKAETLMGAISYGAENNKNLNINANNNKVEMTGGQVTYSIYGGFASDGNANDNEVIITGGLIAQESSTNPTTGGAGYTEYGNAVNNTLTIEGAIMNGSWFGGDSGYGTTKDNNVVVNDIAYADYGESANVNLEFYGGRSTVHYEGVSPVDQCVYNNSVTFSGGDADKYKDIETDKLGIDGVKVGTANSLYGGYSFYVDVLENHVTINGNAKVTDLVAGGYSVANDVINNTINISEDSIVGTDTTSARVVGGYSESTGNITGNTVTIDGNSTVYGEIVGGLSSYINEGGTESYEVTDNSITLAGNSTIIGHVYGGSAGDDTVQVSGNSITLQGKTNVEQADLYGYKPATATFSNNVKSSAGDRLSNNNLIIDGWTGTANSVQNFNNIKFNNLVWNTDENAAVLTTNSANLDGTNVSFTLQSGQKVNVGESMTLISSSADLGTIANAGQSLNTTMGVAADVSATLEQTGNKVMATVDNIELNDQTMLVAENRAVAAAFVNQGTDLIADSLDTLSRDGKYGVKTFAAVHGNRSKYDVNSDIKINGWSTIVGVGSETEHNGGDFSWGVFYENGSGNYRTFNSFNNEYFRGDGSLVYNGGGIAARYENAHGVYTEGSLRAGMLKSDMDNALSDGENKYGYSSESEYYGAHIGIGQIIPLTESSDLDVYGKFFHTYTEGDSFKVDTDEFEFDSINSDRLRVGARLTTNKENKFSTYYGLAYEYEFNGDAEMRAAGMSAPTQSLQGSSYMAEVGFNYQPTPESPWSFDLNMRGYAGEREGATFNVQATYTF